MIFGSTACLSGSKYTGLPWIILSLSRLPMSDGLAFCRRFPFTITIEEYLVSPYSNGKMEYVDNFKKFIEYMNIEVVDIDSVIAEQGAKIRGKYKSFKAMDALQIATAIIKKCDMFFTNDKQLRQEKELPCMTMEDI